jgi:magnesium transporter
METDVYTVKAEADKEEVAQLLARYDLLAVPVVDADKRLVGIVTHDDVVDVLVQAATEDAERMGGVVPIGENFMEANFFTVWRKRVVWLSLLFVAELFTFTALEHYEDAIKAVTVLSLFIPLCIATGGNSGSQAATLITRALALRQVTPGEWWRVLRKELLMGLALGLSLATIGYFRAALTKESTLRSDEVRHHPFSIILEPGQEIQKLSEGKYALPAGVLQNVGIVSKRESIVDLPAGHQAEPATTVNGKQRIITFPAQSTYSSSQVDRWTLASIVSVAVAAICIIGTVVGALLPLLFKTLELDPAVASSPFVATAVDVTGIIIFFSIACLLIPGLAG